MDAVYLFFEKENIKVPFYNYDKKLFDKLFKSHMGQWEQAARQYQISISGYDQEKMKSVLGDKPFVEVNKEKNNPVIVHSFISGGQTFDENVEPLKNAPEIYPPKKIYPGMIMQTEILSEKFPDYWREKLIVEMRARKYSQNSRNAYIKYNKDLCRWLQKPPEEVVPDDIKRYLAFLEKVKKQSASTLNLALSSFKFFFGEIMKRDIAHDQRRPRQDVRLPSVLARVEMKKMLDCELNLKHRLILMLVYGSGLRVSEVVKLKRQDIDLKRKVLSVSKGKGRKDRDTIISKMALETLEIYYEHYNITDWIFPGSDMAGHLHIRTAQKICKNAIKKAGLEKNASMHSLRHSFATHLLENGADLTRIGKLLGHKSLATTSRYTHVAKRKTLSLTSPLDLLDKEDDEGEEYFDL